MILRKACMSAPARRSRTTGPSSTRRRLAQVASVSAAAAGGVAAGGVASGHPVVSVIAGAVLALPGIGVVIATAVAGRIALCKTESAENRVKLIEALTELVAT